MKKIKLPFKLLTYDIETPLKLIYAFGLGEQVIRHNQLFPRSIGQSGIICIAAKWYHKKKVMVFVGDDAIEKFDQEARKADVCLGKNSDRFDVKRINSERMLQGLKPYPEWMNKQEDLEKQLRRYFHFDSQSLDYISTLFGTGGKNKMEFQDWVDIYNYQLLQELMVSRDYTLLSYVLFDKSAKQVLRKGKAALKKMIEYNKKDVLDTEAALVRVLPHIKLKHNAAAQEDGYGCTTCGSKNLIPTQVIIKGKTKYQEWECLDHKGYGGRCTWYYKKGSHHRTYGKMS